MGCWGSMVIFHDLSLNGSQTESRIQSHQVLRLFFNSGDLPAKRKFWWGFPTFHDFLHLERPFFYGHKNLSNFPPQSWKLKNQQPAAANNLAVQTINFLSLGIHSFQISQNKIDSWQNPFPLIFLTTPINHGFGRFTHLRDQQYFPWGDGIDRLIISILWMVSRNPAVGRWFLSHFFIGFQPSKVVQVMVFIPFFIGFMMHPMILMQVITPWFTAFVFLSIESDQLPKVTFYSRMVHLKRA